MAAEVPSVLDSLIDLKPDSSLLDANFDGYKLSLDPLMSFDVHLPSAVRVMQTSNAQYGLEHVKLFNDTNYLIFDHYSSDNVTKRFYTITEDLRVCSINFNMQEKKFAPVEAVSDLTLPSDLANREERYPATISFPDQELAIVANGYGLLSMFITGNRSMNSPWKDCMNIKPLLIDDDSGAFIVSESRRLSDNMVVVLLRTIVAKERSSSKAHFWNKLFWITLTKGDDGWHVSRTNEVICEGHVELATFDSTADNLIVVSSGDTTFTADTKSHCTPLVEDDSIEIVEQPKKKDRKAYAWIQDKEDVQVVFKVPEYTVKSEVSMSISGSKIRLAVCGTILLNGQLGGPVDVGICTCTLDSNKLELKLSKCSMVPWKEVVVGDERGLYCEKREILLANFEFLQRFPTDSQTPRESNASKTFNTEQLEDCDMTNEEISKIRWLCGETHTVKYMSDITGHNVLFAVALGIEPQCLCLRMDVDGILWSLDCCEGKLATHRATFNAFGYVQASKAQRKFCTCSPDCSYAAIVEAKRHAFVYWQPTAVFTDLRHRESGRRVAAVAKQNLISLSKVDSMGDNATASEDIIGVYADNNALFILTNVDLFAIILK